MKHTVSITTQWDGTRLSREDEVRITVSVSSDTAEAPNEPCLVLEVDAPFFNDPKPHLAHEATHLTDGKGCLNFDGLWNFEVVEFFIKGRLDKYLEIEMGPHGHYLVLACDGYRQCFRRGIEPIAYSAIIEGTRWTGRLVCPVHLLPPPTDIPSAPFSFNAYAIHDRAGSATERAPSERVYCIAFPPNQAAGEYATPDFHKLELFEHFPEDFSDYVCSSCHPAAKSVWADRDLICTDYVLPSATGMGELSPRE